MAYQHFTLPLAELRHRSSIKWRRYPTDIIPAWVAEMDLKLDPLISEALTAAIQAGDTGYPGTTEAYVAAFRDYAARSWNWPAVQAVNIRPIADVISGYVNVISTGLDGPGTVIVTPPVYPPFYSYLEAAGHRIQEVPLTSELRLDIDALTDVCAQAKGPMAFLLCNPHNPGGTVHTRAELEAVSLLAERYGLQVVSDEIHAPLTYSDAEFVPYLTVDNSGVALHSASKAWNLAAMPAALAVFGDHAPAWEKYRSGVYGGPTHLGVIAQTTAYSSGTPWLNEVLSELEQNRALALDLAAPIAGLKYHWPAATYLAWLDFRGRDWHEEPYEKLLREAGVALNPGSTFGAGGAGHVRLNLATSPEILREIFHRISALK